jgi:hypothetical protein
MDSISSIAGVYIIAFPFIFMILLALHLGKKQYARKCGYYMRLNLAHQLLFAIPVSLICFSIYLVLFGEEEASSRSFALMPFLILLCWGGVSCAFIYSGLFDYCFPSEVIWMLLVIIQSLLFACWMGRIYFHMMLRDELESNPPLQYFFLRPEVRWYWLGFVLNPLLIIPGLLLMYIYYNF